MIGEIKRFIRDDGPIKVSRSIKELNIKINEIKREYLLKKGEEISIEEISKELKISKEDICLALDSTNNIESIDNATYYNYKDGNKINLIEKLSSNKENEEDKITNMLTIKQLIKNLNKRDKEIIMLRYFKEKTQTQVAKILGITQVQVSRIERKILDGMRQEFQL